jgi:hypothetical protein
MQAHPDLGPFNYLGVDLATADDRPIGTHVLAKSMEGAGKLDVDLGDRDQHPAQQEAGTGPVVPPRVRVAGLVDDLDCLLQSLDAVD